LLTQNFHFYRVPGLVVKAVPHNQHAAWASNLERFATCLKLWRKGTPNSQRMQTFYSDKTPLTAAVLRNTIKRKTCT